MRLSDEKIEEILFREKLQVAPFSKRALAFLIDEIIISMLFVFIFYTDFTSFGEDRAELLQMISHTIIYLVLLKYAYHSIFTFFYGASVGKLFVKIKIIQIDSLDTPDLLTSLLRCFFRLLGQELLYITYFFAWGDRFIRTLHDRFVRTIVILQD